MECRGCKKEIKFARNPATGKQIPLEKVQAWEIDWKKETDQMGREVGVAIAVKVLREIHISHFLTCPAANQFSGAKK